MNRAHSRAAHAPDPDPPPGPPAGSGGSHPLDPQPADPLHVRAEFLELFLRHRHWPGSTPESYRRLWEWRYRAMGEGPALAWVVRSPSEGRLIGHLAVFPRRYRLGESELLVGVPGDILVDEGWRHRGVGRRLLRIPSELARTGRFELVLVGAAPTAHSLFRELGHRPLGPLQDHVDLRRSRATLERRWGPVGRLAPVVDVLLAARRHLHASEVRAARSRLGVERPEPVTEGHLDRGHWRFPDDRLVPAPTARHLIGRFLQDPVNRRRLYAVRRLDDDRLEAYVVVERRGDRATVAACAANAETLDAAAAIALVARSLPATVRALAVPTLPGSLLGRRLTRLGFLRRSRRNGDGTGDIHFSAFWRPGHPLASRLSETHRWHLFPGAGDG